MKKQMIAIGLAVVVCASAVHARYFVVEDPFAEVERGLSEFGKNLRDWAETGMRYVSSPAADMYEKDGNIVIEVHTPGYEKNELKVQVENGTVKISGKQEKQKEEKDKTYYRREVQAASFERVLKLPAEVISDRTTAEYKNGVLTVTIPKKEVKKPSGKEIQIR